MEHEPGGASESSRPHFAVGTGGSSNSPPAALASTDGARTAPPATQGASSAGPVHAARGRELAAVTSSAPAASPPAWLSRRGAVIVAIVVVVVAAATYFGAPVVTRAVNTVSTDDAYVNGHYTFVAARVPGQVVSVLVDDNYRVRKGDVLVRLDPQPYQVIVDAKRAAYDLAKSNLTVTHDSVRAMIATARAARFKMDNAVEDVDNQIAILRANVAKLALANADWKRALELEKTPGVISAQQVDQYKAAYDVALQQVYQTRVGLGLPERPKSGKLDEVPPDLDQNFSTVRQAVAQLQQAAAPLGIVSSSFNLTPKALLADFYKSHHNQDIDAILAQIAKDAPQIKQAEAQLHQARADLDQAELNLSYCTVYAEIDGAVTGRNVNPGDNVTAGQSLMAVRSLTEIWIDANFKETQLSYLRIGQPAELDVDMYGSHKLFKGHITGFEMGTGSTLALLPPENATGNFVKIVQRLPVRIEVDHYHPDKDPLFYGLSVTPYVYYKEKPTGPNAGQYLQEVVPEAAQERSPPSGAPRASGAGAKLPKNP